MCLYNSPLPWLARRSRSSLGAAEAGRCADDETGGVEEEVALSRSLCASKLLILFSGALLLVLVLGVPLSHECFDVRASLRPLVAVLRAFHLTTPF